MKCKGKIKKVNKLGKTVLEQCNYKLMDNEIYCPQCGEPTKALNEELSAWKIFTQTVTAYWKEKNRFLAFGALMLFVGLLPILIAVFVTDNYWISNLLLLITVPLALVPLAASHDFLTNGLGFADFTSNLRYYPRFLIFTFANILFFLLIKILCTGFLLNVATDPILHPVRLILVLYWLAIVMPVPFIMVRHNLCPGKAIKSSYVNAAETRWQHFFLYLMIAALNVIGAAVLVVGLLVTIPLSYIVLDRYFLKLDRYCDFS